MAGYNRTRYVEQLLEKTESLPPSFAVHLHSEYWVLNNGSKFLYNNQIASLLDDIRAHRIPIDFLELFDSARVPFYEGCMVVELLDYRPQKSSDPALKNPNKTRVVLHPSPETLWADICSLNQRNGGRWTDMDALEIEAKLLLATTQPLCLDPDPHLTRIVNNVLRVSTPSMPISLKRKSSAMGPEEDGPEKAKRERLLGFMAPRDNRLHAPSYRLLDAIEINKPRKEANKAGANPPCHQYMPTSSQSVQPVPQPTPTPQPVPSASVAAHSPQGHGETPAQTIDTPQTFNVPFRPNEARTPVPQPAHQFVGQHPSAATLQPNMTQSPIYVTPQAVQEAAIKRVSTPTQPYYMQQYLYPQPLQQQQPHQTPPQPQLPRPPSQPQHLPAQPNTQANQTLPSPQPPTLQLNAQLGQPQRYTQTPKPQVLPATVQPNQTQQQQPNVSASPFQGTVPNPHFVQPAASAIRQRTPLGQPGSIQHPHLTLPTNTNPSQSPHLYNPQLQQQGQPSFQQQQAQQLYQQRFSQAGAGTGGRTTPGQPQPSPRLQPQATQPNRAVTATPSPAKNSPVVHPRTIGTPIQPKVSPMPAKAQIPIQHSGSGQPLPVLGQQSQLAQQPVAQQLSPGGMHLQPQRYQFQSQPNHSQLRPLIHGNSQLIVTGTAGTPTMAHASPVVGGRPLTPAEGKSPHLQTNQTQQQPVRRPTPLQHQQPTAVPAHLVKQPQKTPQLQPQQLPQSQMQGQQIQGQAQASPQVQQANLAARQQQMQHQQMNTFAQMYGFPHYWGLPAQQQGQNSQPVSATAVGQLPPQMVSMSPQQQSHYQHHIGLLANQLQQSPGPGQRMTQQQMQLFLHNKLLHAMTQSSPGQIGGQQVQGGQSMQQPTQQVQQSQQHPQLQAAMMSKVQMQMGPQIHMHQGHSQGVGGQGQPTNISPHMSHFQQLPGQHNSPIAQAQHVGQQKAKPTAKKGPAGR